MLIGRQGSMQCREACGDDRSRFGMEIIFEFTQVSGKRKRELARSNLEFWSLKEKSPVTACILSGFNSVGMKGLKIWRRVSQVIFAAWLASASLH